MGFAEAVQTCFRKFAMFDGRARRSEFWWWVLLILVASFVLGFIDSIMFGTMTTGPGSVEWSTDFAPLSSIFLLAALIPSVSVTVRRLHDKDRSGWWYWIGLIPVIGALVLLYWFVTRGTEGPNRFGEDPLGGGSGGAGFSDSSIPNVPRD